MTTVTQELTLDDYRILCDLKDGKVPRFETVLSNGVQSLYPLSGKPCLLEEITLDIEKTQKDFESRAKATKFSESKSAGSVYIDEKTGQFHVNQAHFGISFNDFADSLRYIAVPANAQTRATSFFGGNVFKNRMFYHPKGYAIGAATKNTLDYDGWLYPAEVKLFDATDKAMAEWRTSWVASEMIPYQDFAVHCQGISLPVQFDSYEKMCNAVNFRPSRDRCSSYMSFGLFEDGCNGINIDEQRRLKAHIHGICNSFAFIRPILSTGEICTAQTIDKYLK